MSQWLAMTLFSRILRNCWSAIALTGPIEYNAHRYNRRRNTSGGGQPDSVRRLSAKT